MGKIIKDGFDFMRYVNSSLIRKIDDIPELKTELILLSEYKTHAEMAEYALLLAEHILRATQTRRTPEIEACFTIVKKWREGQSKFQQARDAADIMNRLARDEKDPVSAKVLRAMGQVAATPHVKWHALAASEYAVVIVNLMYPKDFDEAQKERKLQIKLMQSV